AAVGALHLLTAAPITISGPDAAHYSLAPPTTTASITGRPLTVTGITASDKAYDGTTTATLTVSSAALVGVVTGETVTLSTAGATGTFATAGVGVTHRV